MGLALRGHKTLAIDFDIGLRNLDLLLGHEKRVVYDIVNVMRGEVSLADGVIQDQRCDNLYMLAGSQFDDKDVLEIELIEKMLDEAREQFDYIVCDSPAGIEHGAAMAMYFADDALLIATPEKPSLRDTDRMLGLLNERTHRARKKLDAVKPHLVVNRYRHELARKGHMLTPQDMQESLSIKMLGIVPDSETVTRAANSGQPVILDHKSIAGQAYVDTVARYLGESVPFVLHGPPRKGLFGRMFSRRATV